MFVKLQNDFSRIPKSVEILIITFYTIVNFFFPKLYNLPFDILVNVLIILFYSQFIVKLLSQLHIVRRIIEASVIIKSTIVIFFGYLLIIVLNSLINNSIYYLYQLARNTIFVVTSFLIFYSINSIRVIKTIYWTLWCNNLIILLKLFGMPFIDNFIQILASVFGFDARFDYRTNGIAEGPLKASIISTIIFFISLFLIRSLILKIITSVITFMITLIQARTSLILQCGILLIYIVFILLEYKKKHPQEINKSKKNGQSFLKILSIALSVILLIIVSFIILGANFQNFDSTIGWLFSELTNLADSKTIKILTTDAFHTVRQSFDSGSLLEILIGDGRTNWAGPVSISTDSGFATLLIGIGILGSITLYLLHFLVNLLCILKASKETGVKLLFISCFIYLLIMNFKSTSVLSYHYFNTYILLLFIVLIAERDQLFRREYGQQVSVSNHANI